MARAGCFAARFQVPLVGQERKVGADFALEPLLPHFYLVDQRCRLFRLKRPQVELDLVVVISAEARQAHRHDTHRLHMWKQRGEVGNRAVEVLAIIDIGKTTSCVCTWIPISPSLRSCSSTSGMLGLPSKRLRISRSVA